MWLYKIYRKDKKIINSTPLAALNTTRLNRDWITKYTDRGATAWLAICWFSLYRQLAGTLKASSGSASVGTSKHIRGQQWLISHGPTFEKICLISMPEGEYVFVWMPEFREMRGHTDNAVHFDCNVAFLGGMWQYLLKKIFLALYAVSKFI